MENLHEAATTTRNHHRHQYYNYSRSPSTDHEIEIEEEEESSSELFELNNRDPMPTIIEEATESDSESMFSYDIHGSKIQSRGIREDYDCVVHVVIGKSESTSVDALSWTLKNIGTANLNSMVYLLHIYPEVHRIPYPLGMIPKSQASPEHVKHYMAQESVKRRVFLQKFIDMCSASKVKVDIILIESDSFANAIVDLIPILNMRKLVLGTTKSSLRKLTSKRGNGCANQILQNAPDFCNVKIICEGKEVINLMNGSQTPPTVVDDEERAKSMQLQIKSNRSPKLMQLFCFGPPRTE